MKITMNQIIRQEIEKCLQDWKDYGQDYDSIAADRIRALEQFLKILPLD